MMKTRSLKYSQILLIIGILLGTTVGVIPLGDGSGLARASVTRALPSRAEPMPMEPGIDVPTWYAGDSWTYQSYVKRELFGVLFEFNAEIVYTVEEPEWWSEAPRDAFRYPIRVNGYLMGAVMPEETANTIVWGQNSDTPLIGTIESLDINGKAYYSIGDLALLSSETTTMMRVNYEQHAFNISLWEVEEFTPPFELYDFPINTGENWSITTKAHVGRYLDIPTSEGDDTLPLAIPELHTGYDRNFTINNALTVIDDGSFVEPEALTIDIRNERVDSGKYEVTYSTAEKNLLRSQQLGVTYTPEDVIINQTLRFQSSHFAQAMMDEFVLDQPVLTAQPDTDLVITGTFLSGTSPGRDLEVKIPVENFISLPTPASDTTFQITVPAPVKNDHTPVQGDLGSHGVVVYDLSTGYYIVTTLVLVEKLPEKIVAKIETPREGDAYIQHQHIWFNATPQGLATDQELIYRWTFGSDFIALTESSDVQDGMSIRHNFSEPGLRVVKLDILDKSNAGSLASTVVNITIFNDDFARIIDPPSDTVKGIQEAFNLSAAEIDEAGFAAVSYDWELGDGGRDSKIEFSYNYQKLGLFTVTLTVTVVDRQGNIHKGTATRKIDVQREGVLQPPRINGLRLYPGPELGMYTLEWKQVQVAELAIGHYAVYMDQATFNSVEGRQPVATVDGNEWQAIGLQEGKSYYFAVTAVAKTGAENKVVETLALTVKPLIKYKGTIVGTDNKPITDATVSILNTNNQKIGIAVTDREGIFVVGLLPDPAGLVGQGRMQVVVDDAVVYDEPIVLSTTDKDLGEITVDAKGDTDEFPVWLVVVGFLLLIIVIAGWQRRKRARRRRERFADEGYPPGERFPGPAVPPAAPRRPTTPPVKVTVTSPEPEPEPEPGPELEPGPVKPARPGKPAAPPPPVTKPKPAPSTMKRPSKAELLKQPSVKASSEAVTVKKETVGAGGKIEAKTAIGYQGAVIVYKVKLENTTEDSIADIRVRPFIPQDMFIADEEEKHISLLRKKSAKTVTFKLRPKGECGNVAISGFITYYSHKHDEHRELRIEERQTAIICPMLKVVRVEEGAYMKRLAKLLKHEETMDNIEVPAEALFDIVTDTIRDMNMFMLDPKVTATSTMYRGKARFYCEGVKGLRYAVQAEVIGGGKKAKLILRVYAENEQALIGFYHSILDELQKRTDVKRYIDDALVIQHIGEYVSGSKTTIRDSVVQRSKIQ